MAVLRKEHKTNYTVIANEVFKSNLSLKARGLLSTMLALPDNWHFSERGLQAILPADGQRSVHSAIKELEGGGFLTRERLCGDNGKVIEWVWTFSDYPQQNAHHQGANTQVTDLQQLHYPHLQNAHLDNAHLDNADVENARQLNTKQTITKEERKQKSSTVKDEKHRYGEYANVLLSNEDFSKLQAEFPDWQERIERLSGYMASTGKKYKNHLATIRNWARRDSERQKPARNSDSRASEQDGQGKRIADMTIEEIMEKYSVDYMTAQEMAFDMC